MERIEGIAHLGQEGVVVDVVAGAGQDCFESEGFVCRFAPPYIQRVNQGGIRLQATSRSNVWPPNDATDAPSAFFFGIIFYKAILLTAGHRIRQCRDEHDDPDQSVSKRLPVVSA